MSRGIVVPFTRRPTADGPTYVRHIERAYSINDDTLRANAYRRHDGRTDIYIDSARHDGHWQALLQDGQVRLFDAWTADAVLALAALLADRKAAITGEPRNPA